ncbi:ABC transporter permease [Clostridium sp. MSJ-4]|uniref:ABC transporter permease n=1 Tax=Clostridium simiarum TaxID=2841506 RepID=A0ABS6F2Q9_9CLOT|nr:MULTISPECIES: ABC transporter [Clostridium]MBU5592770.1 ABC transporter permease [Clostridium simiarum]
MEFLISILEQGFIFGITALGVYITYSILDFPDLSVDGTFTLGAAISATMIFKGANPFITLIVAFIGGAIGGFITGVLHERLKITNLLSGILVMIGLYSINLRIMGKANIAIFNNKNIFLDRYPLIILAIFLIITKISLDLFFKTHIGYALKAAGDNETLITSLGINSSRVRILGLMVSNAIVALSGGIMAQYQRFSDISMGNGTVIMALASIIMGQSFIKKEGVLKATTKVIIGAIMYKLSIGIALKLGMPPTDLKLITAIIVVLAIALNNRNILKDVERLFKRGGAKNA